MKKWQQQKSAQHMIDILIHKGFDTYYTDNLDEARDKVLELIPEIEKNIAMS
jgi:hypothetical protein